MASVQLLRPTNPTHRHYKGNLYREISSRVRRESDGVRQVLYEDEKGQLWVRPYEEFIGKVTIESESRTQLVLRYRPITGEV
jgi:hypothetical protein